LRSSSRSSPTGKRKKYLSAAVVCAWLETAGRPPLLLGEERAKCITFASAIAIPSACR
jgi:hypothetical protein